jgi:hypothetical protein
LGTKDLGAKDSGAKDPSQRDVIFTSDLRDRIGSGPGLAAKINN